MTEPVYKDVKYKDGGGYKGWFINGLPHGEGTSKDPYGNVYTGTFHEGIPHGKGVNQFANGERYEGSFAKGRQNGKGIWTHPAGDRYVGEFMNDQRHGTGTYTTASGQSWTGEWRHGKQFKKMDLYDSSSNMGRSTAFTPSDPNIKLAVDVGYGTFSSEVGHPVLSSDIDGTYGEGQKPSLAKAVKGMSLNQSQPAKRPQPQTQPVYDSASPKVVARNDDTYLTIQDTNSTFDTSQEPEALYDQATAGSIRRPGPPPQGWPQGTVCELDLSVGETSYSWFQGYDSVRGGTQGGGYDSVRGGPPQSGGYDSVRGGSQGGGYDSVRGGSQGGGYDSVRGGPPQSGGYDSVRSSSQGGGYDSVRASAQGGGYDSVRGGPSKTVGGDDYGSVRGGPTQMYDSARGGTTQTYDSTRGGPNQMYDSARGGPDQMYDSARGGPATIYDSGRGDPSSTYDSARGPVKPKMPVEDGYLTLQEVQGSRPPPLPSKPRK